MKNPRIPVVIMVVSLVAVAILSLQAFIQPFEGKENASQSSGKEFSQRFEAQKVAPNTGAQGSSRPYSGFGDLRILDAQSSLPNTGAKEGGQTYTGFADLNRVDQARQSAANSTGSSQLASQPGRITGFADLNRVEGQAILPQTGADPAQAPRRVCPQQSTAAGERDAGASAPAYVLQAMGCSVSGSK